MYVVKRISGKIGTRIRISGDKGSKQEIPSHSYFHPTV